jgi:hypothetical protein
VEVGAAAAGVAVVPLPVAAGVSLAEQGPELRKVKPVSFGMGW